MITKKEYLEALDIVNNYAKQLELQIVSCSQIEDDNLTNYECTDCGTITRLKNNGEIRVGYCKDCGHPLWN